MSALRELIAKFGVSFDDTELKKGDAAVSGLADKLRALGGLLTAGAIAAGVKHFVLDLVEQADALNDQAKVLGISTTELQQWQYAAKLSGVEAGELGSALTKFNKNVAEAGDGTGPAADAFRKLGVSVKDSSGKLGQPIDLLEGIATGLKKIENPAERTNALMSLFGKAGARLGPLFEEGADGIKKLKKEFADLGGGFSDDFIESAAKMDDSVDRLSFAWLSFKSRLAGVVIPTIERFVTMGTRVIVAVSKWTDRIGLLSKSSNLAAAAAVVLGAAFLRAGITAIAPWLPMIALLAGAILLVDELITLWKGGDTIIGRALDRMFGPGTSAQATAFLRDVVKSTQDFFSNTTRGWAEFTAGVQLIWFDLVNWIKSTWIGLALATLFKAEFEGMTEGIQRWAKMFVSVWTTIIEYAGKAWEIVRKVADAVSNIPGAKKALENYVPGLLIGKAVAGAASSDPAAIAAQRQAIIDSSVVAPPSTSVQAPVTINIDVPPGTPAQQARAVGDAAAQGARRGNQATYNALVSKP